MDKLRHKLITTTAIAVLYASAASGQDAPPAVAEDTFWVSIEGQYQLYNNAGNLIFDFDPDSIWNVNPPGSFPSIPLFSPSSGWLGGLAIGYQKAGSPYSAVGRLRYGRSDRDSGSSTYTSTWSGTDNSADVSYREEHYIADLEIGRDVGIGAAGGNRARIHGGLRFGHFMAKTDASADSYSTFSSFSGSAVAQQKFQFSGIGPRLGIEATMPINDRLAVTGGIAGALLYGRRKTTVSGSTSFVSTGTSGGTSYSTSTSKDVWVPNFEAEAAFNYLLGPNATFSAGYRIDHYWDVLDFGDGAVDRTIHGPFLRLTIKTGG